jgi:hypothetical protein
MEKKKQKQKTEDLEKWLFLLSQFTYKLWKIFF